MDESPGTPSQDGSDTVNPALDPDSTGPEPEPAPEPVSTVEKEAWHDVSQPRRSLVWFILCLAIAEAIHFGLRQVRTVPQTDFEAAAKHVREHMGQRDLVVSAPSWTSPRLRQALGDAMTFSSSTPNDLAAYERIWVMIIRGARHPYQPTHPTDFVQRFGRVRLQQWELGPSPVLFNFVDHMAQAKAEIVTNGKTLPCHRTPRSNHRAGLGAGAMAPEQILQCDRERPWLWVGSTVMEDLELKGRHCIWQHPAGLEPIRVQWNNIPLGDRIVLYGGIYHDHEIKELGNDTQIAVRVNGQEVGRMIHRDGDGNKRSVIQTRPLEQAKQHPDQRGNVAIEVTAADPHLRSFCWNATVRLGHPERDHHGTN